MIVIATVEFAREQVAAQRNPDENTGMHAFTRASLHASLRDTASSKPPNAPSKELPVDGQFVYSI
jgi:hypothetical protein